MRGVLQVSKHTKKWHHANVSTKRKEEIVAMYAYINYGYVIFNKMILI